MNQKVYHTLEYYKILDRLADYASCEEAKDRCHKLVPLTDPAEIAHLQETTADALSRLYRGSGISFSGVHNVNASLKRLDIGGSLNTTELLMICSLLEVAKRVKAYDRSDRNDEKTDSLSPLFSQIQPLSPLLDEIRRCVVGEDEIADDASAALSKIRKSIRGMNDRIHAQLTGLMNNTTTRSYLQDAVITMRDGRYCIPIKSEYKGQVPGMVHDQSSSGSTLFIEPMAVVNLNNELKELFLKEQEEIDRILADLSNRVAENANGIRQDYTVLAELDFIFAKAELAKSYNGVAPVFNEEGRMHLTVSLLVECQGEIINGEYGKAALCSALHRLCQSHKLAGGSIVSMREPQIFNTPDDEKKVRQILWRLMPGFVLCDRSEWLIEHYRQQKEVKAESTMLDAWLDFAAIKYQAIRQQEGEGASWEYQPKPMPGYLVPMMCGYQRISRLYEAGEVA